MPTFPLATDHVNVADPSDPAAEPVDADDINDLAAGANEHQVQLIALAGGLAYVVAKPLGTAADTLAAINDAIDAAESEGDQTLINPLAGGTKVHLGAGTFEVDGAVLQRSNVWLDGLGPAATVIKLKANTTSNLWKYADDAGTGGFANQWRVSNLRFDGNRANQSGAATPAVLVRRGADTTKSPAYITNTPALMGGDHFGFENVVISNVKGDGMVVGGAGPVAQMYFRNSFVWECTGHGVDFGGVDCRLSDLDIGSCGLAGLKLSGPNNRTSNVKLYGCGKVNDSAWAAFYVEGSYNVFTNIECQENYGYGARILADYCKGDISVQGCSGDGLLMHGGSGNDISVTVTQFNAFQPTNGVAFYPNCVGNHVDLYGGSWAGDALTGDWDAIMENEVGLHLRRTVAVDIGSGPRLMYTPTGLASFADADPIGTWDDESSNAQDATAAGAARPTTGVEVLDGQDVVNLAAGQGFTLPDLSALTAGTVLAVVRAPKDPGDGTSGGLWHLGNDGDGYYSFSDGNIYEEFGTNSRKTITGPHPDLDEWHIYEVVAGAGDWRAYLDGVLIHKTTSNTVAFPAVPTLGKNANSFTGGAIAGFFLFAAVATKFQRHQVREHLRAAHRL